jgi:hypothetical protein
MPAVLDDPRTILGYREHRVNPVTGATVVLFDGSHEYADPEAEGGRWVTLCDTHSYLVNHATRAIARSWLAEPWTWCDECSAIHAEKVGR